VLNGEPPHWVPGLHSKTGGVRDYQLCGGGAKLCSSDY
jgi:hypothetical protein